MPKSEPSVSVTEFVGLNNKSEPRAMVPGELVLADNIDIDDRKKIRRRRGYATALELADLSSAWVTPDESRLFAIAAGTLYEIRGTALELTALATGLSENETYWDWDGERVFVSNDAVDLVIDDDTAYELAIPAPLTPLVLRISGDLPAGRYLVAAVLEDARGRQGGACEITSVDLPDESGLQLTAYAESGFTTRLYVSRTNDTVLRQASDQIRSIDQLGAPLEEMQYAGFAPPPGGPIAYHAGRLMKGMDGPEAGTGLVAASFPFWAHLFGFGSYDFLVPGRVTGLADVQQVAMLVGTEKGIFRHSLDEGLSRMADYGMVPGQPITKDSSGMAYCWTDEGVCRAFPFENLTSQAVSVAPGHRCAVGIVEQAGFNRFVALTRHNGTSAQDNPR